jgi:hypothetical protein
MNRYLVVGCGHFGRLAVEKLLRKDPASKIRVVDKNKKALGKIAAFPVETYVGEGRSFLHRFLPEDREAYVIPAVPFHLVFEFILSRLHGAGWKRCKVPPLPGLPNPMTGKTGDLYVSIANFTCPEECPEPSRYCTVTGERRPKPLYQLLRDLRGPFRSKAIRSEQLGLGVGGFKAEKVLNLFEEIERKKTPGQIILISTACRCHGVISALSF